MAVSTDMELHDKYLNLPRHEFIEYFNSQYFSWKITDYNRTFYFGSLIDTEDFLEYEEIDILTDLPKNFDSRTKWPQCESIKEINDQGDNCGSCWTFGTISYEKDKHFAEKIYKVDSNLNAIRTELFKNGPVQLVFNIYSDYLYYKGGIYEHKYGKFAGQHSVRLIGYGVEKNIEYWIVANSWGARWGENGLFRIKVNQNLLEFEKHLITGLPKN